MDITDQVLEKLHLARLWCFANTDWVSK